MNSRKRKILREMLFIICFNLIMLLNSQNVFAGERFVWEMWRPGYGIGTEISRGEPAIYQSAEAGLDHYTYKYGGFWSGNSYYYSKTILYDTYYPRSYDTTHYYYTNMQGRTAYSGSAIYPDAGLDPDKVYVQVSTDDSTYRTIGISPSFRVSQNSYDMNVRYEDTFLNTEVGTWRYVRAKFPASNKRPSWMTTQDRSATIDGFGFSLKQVDNTAPYGTAPIISNVTSDSFDVTVTGVGDSISSISNVQFATWTTANDQDDIQWYSGTNLGNGIWKYTVNREDHNEEWGEYIVHAYAYDADWAGNNKFLGEVKVNLKDIDAPTLTLSQNTTTWTKGTVTITASASDTHSGIKNIKLPNGTFINGSNTTYSVNANGTYTFVAYDNFGNAVTKSISITNIDATKPGLTVTASPTTWTKGSVIITVSATDSQSGVKQIKKPDGTIINGASTTYSVSANGNYSFEVIDNVGNITANTISIGNIDKVNPNLEFTLSNLLITTSPITINAIGSDTLSGVKQIKLPDGKIVTDNKASYTVFKNGIYIFEITDNVGNAVNKSVSVENLIQINTTSGIDRIEYKLEGSTIKDWTTYTAPFYISNEGVTTIRARSIDKAGNVSTEAINTAKVDKSKPINSGILIEIK